MNPDELIPPGFKRITLSNWREMDDVIQFPIPVCEERWVNACLGPQLATAVPMEIAALFEVARGSMIYGWFFYPLITLATEQCHRVLEAGARARSSQLGLPTKVPKRNGKMRDSMFSEVIEALAKHGVISPKDRKRWDATRNLRNWSSHPVRQSISSPGMALSALDSTVELLNRLYQ